MIVRLEGKVNGQEIIFQKGEGDIWKGVFPFQEKCEAVIELTAYDEAGNFCYKTCYLLTFDPESLYMKLVPADFWLQQELEDTMLICVEPVDFSLCRLPDETYLLYYETGEELRQCD